MTIAGHVNAGADGAGRHGRRLVLFSGVGVANTATDFLVYAGLVAAGAFAPAANGVAFLAANAQSYVVNARVTFRETSGSATLTPGGYAKFLGAHLVSLVISTIMIVAFADAIGPIAAKLASFAFTFAWNYATSAFFVFRRRPAPSVDSESSEPSANRSSPRKRGPKADSVLDPRFRGEGRCEEQEPVR